MDLGWRSNLVGSINSWIRMHGAVQASALSPPEHEVQGTQAQHGEGRRREVDEDAAVFGELRCHRVHSEENIDDLQYHDDEQQQRAAPPGNDGMSYSRAYP